MGGDGSFSFLKREKCVFSGGGVPIVPRIGKGCAFPSHIKLHQNRGNFRKFRTSRRNLLHSGSGHFEASCHFSVALQGIFRLFCVLSAIWAQNQTTLNLFVLSPHAMHPQVAKLQMRILSEFDRTVLKKNALFIVDIGNSKFSL